MNTSIPAGFRQDSVGRLVPESAIKPIDLLRDETALRLIEKAKEVSLALQKLKAVALAEISAFVELSASQYGVKMGGKKGNVSLMTFDGRYKIVRANHDCISFDERLLAAKELIDECLKEWVAVKGVPSGLVVLANRAFRRNKNDEISVSRVLDLRTHEIADARWEKAMEIIADSIKVNSSVTYIRVYERIGESDHYKQVPLDIAGVTGE